MAVYWMPGRRLAAGVKVEMLPTVIIERAVTGVESDVFFKVKLVAVIVAAFISLLKVTVTVLFMGTHGNIPVPAPSTGIVESTVGVVTGSVPGHVVKVHTLLAARALPFRS